MTNRELLKGIVRNLVNSYTTYKTDYQHLIELTHEFWLMKAYYLIKLFCLPERWHSYLIEIFFQLLYRFFSPLKPLICFGLNAKLTD